MVEGLVRYRGEGVGYIGLYPPALSGLDLGWSWLMAMAAAAMLLWGYKGRDMIYVQGRWDTSLDVDAQMGWQRVPIYDEMDVCRLSPVPESDQLDVVMEQSRTGTQPL